VRLYCQCGYPIRIAGQWTGKEYRLLLYDGEQVMPDDPITHCPRCGAEVHPADLHWLAPVTLQATQWEPFSQDSHRERDEQETPPSER
jgi:hypothetical protein